MKIFSLPAAENFPFSELRRYNYDLKEIRLDYTPDPAHFLRRIKDQAALDPFTIITIRDLSEGGIYPFPFEKKISLYRQAAAAHNCLVDCELDLFRKYKPALSYSNLILSHHIKPGTTDIFRVAQNTIEIANNYHLRYLKIVVPVESYSDLQKLPELSKDSQNPLLLCGSGFLGKLSRILWKLSGSKGTFVALPGQKTAGVQLTPGEYDLFGSHKLDEQTLLGGIIGGKQVYDSLGLKYYNQRLRKLDDKIVYLPLPVKDSQDFLHWLQDLNKKIRFYGFSVTMPSKTDLPKHFNVPDKPANLISVRTDRKEQLPFGCPELFYNTDRIAFKKALGSLRAEEDSSILVFGTGATAKCFIEEFSYLNKITVSGRKPDAVKQLAADHHTEYLTHYDLRGKSFDLIVNCTPLGMKNEDLFELTGLALPAKMIDLPYGKGMTKAIEKCAAQKIPFIDGKRFWLYQSKKQEELFLTNLSQLL